jgi:hypothetical protein
MELQNPLTIYRGDARYLAKVIRASCLSTDLVGNCVYISAPAVGGSYQVRTADPTNYSKMPCYGVIESKDDLTNCRVRIFGEVFYIYSGLTPGRPMFVGVDGRLTQVPPQPAIGSSVFVQVMGGALSTDVVVLMPNLMMTKRNGSSL